MQLPAELQNDLFGFEKYIQVLFNSVHCDIFWRN